MKGTMHSMRVAGVLLGVMAALACANSVRAQEVQGKFVLPSAVQWGGWTLPAGEYHFRLPSANSPNAMLIIRDARDRGKLLVTARGKGSASHQSALTIVRRNGRRYVSSLALASIETTFVYSVPQEAKQGRPELEASVQVIPVQLAGS